jgi:hypothetical protein
MALSLLSAAAQRDHFESGGGAPALKVSFDAVCEGESKKLSGAVCHNLASELLDKTVAAVSR